MIRFVSHTKSTHTPVVTASAALCAHHCEPDALWGQVMGQRLVADQLFEDDHLAALACLKDAERSILSREQLLGLAVAELAWQQSDLSSQRQSLRGERRQQLDGSWRSSTGVVTSSALGNLSALLQEQAKPNFRPTSTSLSRWRGNALGAAVAVRFGLQGEQVNLNAASSGGAQALSLACQLVRSGVLDRVLVVAAEPALPPLLREANRRSGAMDPLGQSQPLTASRSGMVPREAAACLMLERAELALDRGATIRAMVLANGSGCEAHHLVAPLPGQSRSLQVWQRMRDDWVRQHGGQALPEIDWLCLHATGTRRFDREEAGFVRAAFPRLPWLTSFKASLGHGLGAAGVVEASLIVEGLNRGLVPPWPRNLDPDLGLPLEAPHHPPQPRVALQLSAGMGGVVVMNLFGHA
jgi:3-oxoacyl-(acyl-carrier-protein) synthase